MPRGVKKFTYEQFRECAKGAGHDSQLISNSWRWVVLGTVDEQPLKPHKVDLTATQLRTALRKGHGSFPKMPEPQWGVFENIAQKLLDS